MQRTPQGVPVIWLHYKADPTMVGERLEKEKLRYSSDALWRREMEVDFEALSGQLVYPEFDQDVHVIAHDQIPLDGCIYMAIDPHPRTPHAFLWVLIDRWDDWYIYREVWPSIAYGTGKRLTDSDEDNTFPIKEYAEAVAYKEGCRFERHNWNTKNEYGKIKRVQGSERVVIRLMDQAGKAFRASGESEQLETYARRYARYGIRCMDPRKSHQAGEDAIHDLLRPRRSDLHGNWPKLHISDQCPELIWELRNHRYKTLKTEDPEKDLKQDAAEVRSHMVDLLRYLATHPQCRYTSRLEGRRRIV